MKKLVATAVLALSLVSTSALAGKPLTPKQLEAYRSLVDAGIDKKDALSVARDPGVKKNEWGWTCDGEDKTVIRVKGEGARYKRNAVCE